MAIIVIIVAVGKNYAAAVEPDQELQNSAINYLDEKSINITQDNYSYESEPVRLKSSPSGEDSQNLSNYQTANYTQQSLNMRLLGEIGGLGSSYDVQVQGDYAYVADIWGGLRVINISDKSNPVQVGYARGFTAHKLLIRGNYAYICSRHYGLFIVDISDPTHPRQVGAFELYDGGACEIAFTGNGDQACVAFGDCIYIFDLANPAQPQVLGSLSCGYPSGVKVKNNYAFVADYSGMKMRVIDISDPSKPAEVTSLNTPGYTTFIEIKEELAVVSCDYDGFIIVDISNPQQPVQLGSCLNDEHRTCEIILDGIYAYVATEYYKGEIAVYDISDPADITAVNKYNVLPSRTAVGLDVRDGFVYLATDEDGLQIVDFSLPASPVWAGGITSPGYCYDVAVADNIAYVAADYEGLRIEDISDLNHPRELGIFGSIHRAMRVLLYGNYALVADEDGTIYSVNVSNPSAPFLAGSCSTTGTFYAMVREGTRLYVADYFNGMQIFDISNPAKPYRVGSYKNSQFSDVLGIAKSGNYCYLADDNVGLVILNVSNPGSISLVGTWPITYGCQDVAIQGNYAYVAATEPGMIILDISNPAQPVEVGKYEVWVPDEIEIAGNYAYLFNSVLEVVDISDPTKPYKVGKFSSDSYASFECHGQVVVDGDMIKIYAASCSDGVLILTFEPPVGLSGNDPNIITRMGTFLNSLLACIGTPVAEPIDSATGAHSLQRSLLTSNGARELAFTIDYYSLLNNSGQMGRGWNHNYETSLEIESNESIILHWNANRCNHFTLTGSGDYTSAEMSVKYDKIIRNIDGSYTLTCRDQSVYHFNANGAMTEQADANGRRLLFTYDTNGKLQTVSEPISGQALNFSYTSDALLHKVTDSLGREVSFMYDEFHNLVTIIGANENYTMYTYSVEGYVLSATDDNGHLLFADTYDSAGRIVSQQDAIPGDLEGTFQYDEVSQPGKIITTYTDREGQTSTLIHDSKYHLVNKTDENGSTVSYTYDENGNRTGTTDANGNTSTFTYDERGNCLSSIDAAGNTTTMTYDDRNNLLSITRPDGKSQYFSYDNKNNLVSLTDTAGNVSQYTYDDNSLMLYKTIAGQGTTCYTYENGLLKTITDPTGVATTYTYDTVGRIIAISDGAGNTSILSYDATDNLLSLTDALGHTVSYTYDSQGNKLTETDANGKTTHFTYNANGKMTSKTDALGNTTTYTYDGEDRLTNITDPMGKTQNLIYDNAGRLIAITDGLGNTITTQYDAAGNTIVAIDASGTTVLSKNYNNINLPTSITDALGRSSSQSYNSLGLITSFADPKGRNSSYNYDDLNNLTFVNDPLSGISKQSFDAAGNRLTLTDPNNNQQTFTYDQAGRITSQSDASGNTVTYTYNNRGLIAARTNARGQTFNYNYDAAGRVSSIITPEGNISYTYDNNGNLLTATDSAGTVTRSYDPLNRVITCRDTSGNTIGYQYDVVGNIIQITYPDNKTVNYSYDAANRLITVTDWANRNTHYSYDKNGRLVQTIRPDGSILTMSYDAAGQLTQQKDVDQNNNTIAQYDFTYDEAGKVKTEQSIVPLTPYTTADINMNYGPDNRLISYNGETTNYDQDGNMINGPLQGNMDAYTYDSRNRLTRAGTTTYTYDAEDHRIGSSEAQYIINPQAGLSQVLEINRGESNSYCIYGLGLLGTEDAAGSYQVYHYDRRGSTVAITDLTGAITDTFCYGPYGEISNHTGDTTTPFLYNGRDGVMTDSNGLYYMRARYYNPETKRFINQDVLLGSIDQGQSLNRFAYVNGSPVSAIDPLGQDWVDGFINVVDNLPGASGPCGSLTPEQKQESHRQTRALLNDLAKTVPESIDYANKNINEPVIKDLPGVAWEYPGQVFNEWKESSDLLEFGLNVTSLTTYLKAGVKSSIIVDTKQGEISEDMGKNLAQLADLIINCLSIKSGIKDLRTKDISKLGKTQTALGLFYDVRNTTGLINSMGQSSKQIRNNK